MPSRSRRRSRTLARRTTSPDVADGSLHFLVAPDGLGTRSRRDKCVRWVVRIGRHRRGTLKTDRAETASREAPGVNRRFGYQRAGRAAHVGASGGSPCRGDVSGARLGEPLDLPERPGGPYVSSPLRRRGRARTRHARALRPPTRPGAPNPLPQDRQVRPDCSSRPREVRRRVRDRPL
jgi:hypothetical protein